MTRTSRRARATWRTYLCMVVYTFAAMGAVLYVAGAVGLFDDPAGTRVTDGVIAAVLAGVVIGFSRLAVWWGPARDR